MRVDMCTATHGHMDPWGVGRQNWALWHMPVQTDTHMQLGTQPRMMHTARHTATHDQAHTRARLPWVHARMPGCMHAHTSARMHARIHRRVHARARMHARTHVALASVLVGQVCDTYATTFCHAHMPLTHGCAVCLHVQWYICWTGLLLEVAWCWWLVEGVEGGGTVGVNTEGLNEGLFAVY